mmetsp:Transcript_5392/g.9321  ORF Transcript_5392/g.9321 Transcript_5392/m.9321 type:complete len:127 (+) Transcript_5392:227-607(+)
MAGEHGWLFWPWLPSLAVAMWRGCRSGVYAGWDSETKAMHPDELPALTGLPAMHSDGLPAMPQMDCQPCSANASLVPVAALHQAVSVRTRWADRCNNVQVTPHGYHSDGSLMCTGTGRRYFLGTYS